MPARRGVLRAVAALASVPLAGCPDGSEGGTETDDPSPTATDTPTDAAGTTETVSTETASPETGTAANGTATPGGPADCGALSYEARTLPAGQNTPATVTASETYLEVTVTVDVEDPPDLGGTIQTCAGPRAVQQPLERGEQTFRFGPYERDCVENWDFWLVGCREPTATGEATETENSTAAPNETTQGL